MEIGPYLSVRPGFRSMAVTPRPFVVDAIMSRTVSIAYDSINFEVIIRSLDEALVVAKHDRIFGGPWVSVIDPLTIPGIAPSRRALEILAEARRHRTPDGYFVALDAFLEDGAEEDDPLLKMIRERAARETQLLRRRTHRTPTR